MPLWADCERIMDKLVKTQEQLAMAMRIVLDAQQIIHKATKWSAGVEEYISEDFPDFHENLRSIVREYTEGTPEMDKYIIRD